MTDFVSRAYRGGADLPALIDFSSRLTGARCPGLTRWNPGDISWQLAGFPAGFDFSTSVRLWEDERGRVVALAAFAPPLNFEYDIDPECGEEELGEEVLAFIAEQRAAIRGAEGEIAKAYAMLGEDALATSIRDSDGPRIAFLEARVFVKVERHSVRYSRTLDGELPVPTLPPGMRLRNVTEADIDERAELHRDAWSVWGNSTFSANKYRRIRAAPNYDETLDIVVEGEDGRLLSYCITWFDEANGIGHFEPVGTRRAFAGKGLGRAVVMEGLRRLKERGAHTALIGTASVNAPALRTYDACGFGFVEREHYWVRRV